MKHILDLLEKVRNVKDGWGQAQDEAFADIKRKFTDAPVLAHPDYEKGFKIYSDASDWGAGAVLFQDMERGPQPLGFYSKKWKPAETRYSVPEKETLAMVLALEHFRVFIYGYPVQCLVDQRGIMGVLKANHPSKYVRYREGVEVYRPQIKYVQGASNVADWFSRYSAEIKREDDDVAIDERLIRCGKLEVLECKRLRNRERSCILWKILNNSVKSYGKVVKTRRNMGNG